MDLYLDLLLAVLHHLVVFALAGLLAAELALARPGLDAHGLAILGRVDAAYGGAAGLIVLIGASRVFFGLKGWEYYVASPAFWLKMAAFVVVGLLSIRPTRIIAGWRRSGGAAEPGDVAALRRQLWLEAAFLALVLTFAAAMARGIGG